MQQFLYTAKDATGKIVKAEVEAGSVSEASKLLVSRKLFPLSITERKDGVLAGNFDQLRRITSKDKTLFTRQLATLVKAGLPLARAIHILTEQTENPKMLRIIKDVGTSIEGGSTLAQALAKYPDIFPTIYISMVEAGEISGDLEETLLRLAMQEEKSNEISSKIRGALTYPIVVLVVLLAVIVLMITVVLPQVGKMYSDLGKPLPGTTQILLGTSSFIGRFWYLFVALFAGAGYGLRQYLHTADGRKTLDDLKLRIPLVSVLMQKMYMARFTRTLGALVSSGVPLLQSLTITSKAISNVIIEKEVVRITGLVKAGAALSKPVSESNLFLPLVSQMINVGEQTGTLGDSLGKAASYYEEEVDDMVKNISTLVEPATMIVLGLMVAFIIASVLLPIYGLVSSVR